MSSIIYLASYPKSGNTWFRTFISNLLKEKDEEVSINSLKTDGIFSSRSILDSIIGIESSNLTSEEIDCLLPRAYNYMAGKITRNMYIKVHDAYTYLPDGGPILGTFQAKGIYIMRNPLDVAVSFAKHSSRSLDVVIDNMGNEDFCMCKQKAELPIQLRQILLSWSLHAESWTSAKEIPVHVIRYEDMQEKPLETFRKAVEFIGLPCSDVQIEEALRLSSFDTLKKQEKQNGFKEKPSKAASFFREGKVGDWRNHFTEEQRDRIIATHGDTMRKFGYLDDFGKPVY